MYDRLNDYLYLNRKRLFFTVIKCARLIPKDIMFYDSEMNVVPQLGSMK